MHCVRFDFHENYVATAKIGEGAFGQVFKIKKVDAGLKGSTRKLAVKAISKKDLKSKTSAATLRNEIVAMRRVKGNSLFVQFL